MLLVRDTPVAVDPVASDPTALIAAARRRQRRRWCSRLAVGAAVLGVTVAIVALATSGTPSSRASAGRAAGTLPTGPLATLHAAGPLAVGPDGALYVTDTVGGGGEPGGDRVLVRLPDGRFRVVAGTGKPGFSGDGGPAVRAELSDVSGLAVAPDGTLYIADGGRVRTVTRQEQLPTAPRP
jgi:serine/threonine-protein kinase